jgi:hypothetical protein
VRTVSLLPRNTQNTRGFIAGLVKFAPLALFAARCPIVSSASNSGHWLNGQVNNFQPRMTQNTQVFAELKKFAPSALFAAIQT